MSKLVIGAVAFAAALARPARADVWLGGEAPLAVAISDGQRGVFRPGLLPAGGVYVGRGAMAFGVRMRAGFLRDGAAPASDREDPGTGGLVSTTIAARLRFGGPWIEAAAGGGVTGSQLAPTFELAAGLSFANAAFELGPSVRYVQVRSVDAMDAFGSADLLLVGLDVKLGGKPRPRPLREIATRAPIAQVARVEAAPAVAIDRDGDVVIEREASCVHDLLGCPMPDGIEVLHDRLILDERVLFDLDRARVRSKGRELVQRIVALWKLHDSWERITIEGHTDVRGSDAYNQWLSEERARRVRDVMVQLGSRAEAIEAVGLGRSRPRDPGHGEGAHQRNRRVEFVIDRRTP